MSILSFVAQAKKAGKIYTPQENVRNIEKRSDPQNQNLQLLLGTLPMQELWCGLVHCLSPADGFVQLILSSVVSSGNTVSPSHV